MIKLSVLFFALFTIFQLIQCRRLNDNDMDNDIGVAINNNGNNNNHHYHGNTPNEWVKISVPPMDVVTKSAGSYIELECEAMGKPPPSIQWLKDKAPITVGETYENNLIDETLSEGLARVKARLVINHLLLIHQGRFTCLATNGKQQAHADTNLYVMKKEGYDLNLNFTQLLKNKILGAYHPPRVTFWAPTYMDIMGANVVLPCHTVGNPKPTVTWYNPQGEPIDDNDGRITMLSDGDLSIASVNWGDMGLYSCVAINSVGQDTVETFLYPMSRES